MQPPRLGLWASFGILALAGCRAAPPTDPIPNATSVCCEVTSEDRRRSAGCQVRDRCRASEPVWMTGNITCTPVDADRCKGGRCCTFSEGPNPANAAVRDWESE